MNRTQKRKRSRGGAAIVEFVLAAALIYTPLILGTIVIGMNLIRAIQLTQLNRDAGHMFARGVDFSVPANQAILQHLAGGLDLTPTGKSVVILSQIMRVDCPGPPACANHGLAVFVRQIVLGNSSLRPSRYGTPPTIAGGMVPNYQTNTAARTVNFYPSVMDMQLGETAYVAEAYYRSSELDLPGFMTSTGVAARGIF
jgi:hypothetical protein